jgi:hypothetical protein
MFDYHYSEAKEVVQEKGHAEVEKMAQELLSHKQQCKVGHGGKERGKLPSVSLKGAHSSRRWGSPMINLHPESFTAYSSSSLFQRALNGTATAPMEVAARKARSNSG